MPWKRGFVLAKESIMGSMTVNTYLVTNETIMVLDQHH